MSPPQVNGEVGSTIVSKLPGNPELTLHKYNSQAGKENLPGYATFKPFSESFFSYRYDLGAGAGATVDAEISVGANSTMDLSGGPLLIRLKRENFDITTDGVDELTILFIDSTGNQASRRLVLSDTYLTYSIDLSEDSNFNEGAVTCMVLRQTFADIDPTTYQQDRRGEIFVHIGGVDVPMMAGGVTAFSEGLLSEFPQGTTASPGAYIRGAGSVPGFITFDDQPDGIRGFRYDVGGSAGATVTAEIVPASNEYFDFGGTLVMALKNNGNDADARLRVRDKDGNEQIYEMNLSDVFLNFYITFVDDGLFDKTQIAEVIIEIDRGLSPNRLGRIDYYLPEPSGPDPFTALKTTVDAAVTNHEGATELQFTPIQDAQKYRIQVATDSGFTNIIHEGFPGTSPETIPSTDALTDGTYYVRVLGSKDPLIEVGPLSQWSDTFSFDVIRNAFIVSKPTVNGAGPVSGGRDIGFSGVSGAVIYQVQVATDPAFNDIVHDGFPAGTSEVAPVTDAGQYYVRVRASANNSFDTGPRSLWSDTFNFAIDAPPASLQPDPTLTGRAITEFPAGTDGGPFTFPIFPAGTDATSTTAGTARGMQINYDTGTPGWAAGAFSFDNFTTGFVGSSNFSGFTNLVLGMFGDHGTVKLELEDIFGAKSSVLLGGIVPGEEKIWKVPMSSFTGIDLTKLRFVILVVEGDNIDGSLTVNRIKPDVVITPSTTLTTADLPGLPNGQIGAPGITSVGPGGNATDKATATPRGVLFEYNTGSAGWAGGGFSYDDFTTNPAQETGDWSGLQSVAFGLQDLSGTNSRVKVEVLDSSGDRSVLYLEGVDPDKEQVFEIPISALGGIDLSKVRIIYFIVEGPQEVGSLQINYLPDLDVYPSDTLGLDDLVDFRAGSPTGFIQGVSPGGDASSNLADYQGRGTTLAYNTGTQGWTGGGYTFAPGSKRFDTLSKFTVGLMGDVSRVKLELIDNQGKKASVHLNGIRSDIEQVWEIDPVKFAGIDLANVQLMFFIVEGNGQQGNLHFTNVPVAVPSGWELAPSNSDFAFKVDVVVISGPNDRYTLQLLDTSGPSLNIIDLLTIEVPKGGPSPFSPLHDVSPDGKWAVYSTKTSGPQGDTYDLYIKDLASADLFTATAQSAGELLKGIDFADGKILLLQESSDFTGTVLAATTTFDPATKVTTLGGFKLLTQGASVYIDDGEPILVHTEYLGGTPEVFVYDTSNGTRNMTLLHAEELAPVVGTNPPFETTFADAHVITTGRLVVTVAMKTASYNKTILIDPNTGQKLVLTGAATQVRYIGNFASYVLLKADGTSSPVTVDLSTFTIV
ncbi:MAG: hypothetical protein Q8R76_09550 [Candidatus Omnitrophota bacterium]|nr:hypothetical protein [Candidatus Omnitrophota bacterium]